MIAAKDIVAALSADNCGGTIKFAGGAGSMPAAADQVQNSPAAFVLPPGEAARTNDAGTAALRQTVTVNFRIAVVFLGIGATGGDQSDAIDAAREGIKDALLGKTLADMTIPVGLVSCGVADIQLDAGYLIYGLEFSTGYHLRK